MQNEAVASVINEWKLNCSMHRLACAIAQKSLSMKCVQEAKTGTDICKKLAWLTSVEDVLAPEFLRSLSPRGLSLLMSASVTLAQTSPYLAELQDFFPRLIVSIQDIDGPIVSAQLPPEPSPRPPDMEEGSTTDSPSEQAEEATEQRERVPLIPAGATVLVETTPNYAERGVLKKPNRGGICVVKMLGTNIVVRPHRRLVHAAPPRFELGQVVQVRRMRSPELYVDVFVVKDHGDSIDYRVTKREEVKRRRKTGIAVIRRVRVPLRSRDGGGGDFVDCQAAMVLRSMST
tara:strand:- start:414 stop:1280 length:867 start_codon:yes stop_codon:yes gene_type:complete